MSTRFVFRAFLTLAVLLLPFQSDALAQKKKTPPKEKKEAYVIVETLGEFQVIKKEEVAGLKKQVAAEYKEAVKAYNEAKKEAKKNKEKFTEAKPKKPTVKAHGGVYPSVEEAEKVVETLKEKAAKKGEKKTKKGGSGKKTGSGKKGK